MLCVDVDHQRPLVIDLGTLRMGASARPQRERRKLLSLRRSRRATDALSAPPAPGDDQRTVQLLFSNRPVAAKPRDCWPVAETPHPDKSGSPQQQGRPPLSRKQIAQRTPGGRRGSSHTGTSIATVWAVWTDQISPP
jgi:hypothetical protein